MTALDHLPVVILDSLIHVGDLNPDSKGDFSHEGQGLSVSFHPHEWRQIARLTGPQWTFDRTGRFLPWHQVSLDDRMAMIRTAEAAGWVCPVVGWNISYWDDEMDDTMMFTTYDTDEADSWRDEATVEQMTVFVTTDTFPDTTAKVGDIAYDDLIATVWVNAHRPDLDGVWWDDVLDVPRLSAPRGVIVPSRIPDWIPTAHRS